MKLKGTDPVLVHPKSKVIHEQDASGEDRCGCGKTYRHGSHPFMSMTRKEAKAIPGSRNCLRNGCYDLTN